MRRLIPLLLLVLILLAACSSNKQVRSTDANIAHADELFARGKYARAAQIYDKISFERRSASTAHATFRQAECYYNINKFSDARAKYEQFIDSFPDHEDVPSAYFRIGQCYFEESLPPQYDQDETIACIELFQNFVQRYPNDERYPQAVEYIRKSQYKLLEKKYLNGYIYYRMKDYSAALMYFDEIIALGNIDELDRKALFYSAKLHLHQQNRDKALASYNLLSSRYPESKEAKKLSKKFK
ncbi:MAG: outer membrane protein assembly factor BamD [Candidatus Cloacimonetes bacterium]|nr:outer membrane protein assembly factor BamD [Candidatus Cloacimonadota bacterium]